jgi:hypothetical protein
MYTGKKLKEIRVYKGTITVGDVADKIESENIIQVYYGEAPNITGVSLINIYGSPSFPKLKHIVPSVYNIPEGQYYFIEEDLDDAINFAEEACYLIASKYIEHAEQVVGKFKEILNHKTKMWIDLQDFERQPWIDAAAESLGDLLYCTRTWSAWSVGTMKQ